MTALRAATSVAADAVGLGGSVGGLQRGYAADSLVVDGDVAADPTALHRVRAVCWGGEQVSR